MDALLTRARAILRSEGAAGAAEAQATLAEASELIDETGAHCRNPAVHEVSAEIARLLGDDATRTRELREARRYLVEMGASEHADRLAREIGC